MLQRDKRRKRRHKRIRSEIRGTKDKPRFNVYRSNKHIYGQLIDDTTGNILASAKDIDVEKDIDDKNRKVALAFETGKILAKKASKKDIEEVVFDRGGYKYHGRVKALAEGAREGGLKF
ncbi:MAG: 50S ribosomal protein L18 [Patescibacteria group bacterium]